jgi:hypothetical protein
MTELQHLASDTSIIDRADPEAAAAMVTKALEESRSWLAVAMTGTDPTPIAEFKAWAATVEEATRQKKLGREIELNAAEMVRRAERGIGVAIRRGQEAGEIATEAEIKSYAGRRRQHGDKTPVLDKPKPTEYASQDELTSNGVGAYALADGVTDERFEEAITDAKAEGNLSRTNVVRKIKGQSAKHVSRTQKADLIADLADQGFSSRQMAKQVGVSDGRVRDIAREFGVEIPADKAIAKTRLHDPNRIVQETVNALAGLAMGVELIDFDALDLREAHHWVTSLDESFRALNRFRKQIKEITQ